ncbi:PRK06851 family protein [Lentibacillus sp. CBA3610]|uniref:PRK06851 family protein n=1 Tax=Lentibacillus sp. CBA3610 TaxID=2518176 RepID=UPI001594E75C|nr:PRK06851 family protein [Lentibacillus sp. CBA3610]QKY71368.1 hypothetical protein Len3610_19045 [Lentibacillus sp. CBA3610]
MSQIKNYYAGSNSSLGFYSLYEEALAGLEYLYILKGGPGTGKSTLIRKVGNTLAEKGFDIEFLHCSSDNDSLDGLLVPSLKAGIVDGTAPHIVDPKYPGAVDRIINLGDFRDDKRLSEHKEEIVALTNEITETFAKAYETFSKARKIHDDLEDIYLSAIDFHKANQVADNLIEKIFPETVDADQNPANKYRFFGAVTPKGAVHFYKNLTEGLNKRFIVKGRAGSGKSTMMKKIGKHAEDLGLEVEYYPCAFDPESMDMVIVPTLSTAILDGTAPHLVEPNRAHDEVVDMFELCIEPAVEMEKLEDIRKIETSYKYLMQRATNDLAQAKETHDQLEGFYVTAMDFEAIGEKTKEIISEISSLAE